MEHGVNFKMTMPWYQLEDLFACSQVTMYMSHTTNISKEEQWLSHLPVMQALFSPLVQTQLYYVGGPGFRWEQNFLCISTMLLNMLVTHKKDGRMKGRGMVAAQNE
jgi:hypothetical protein